MSLHALTDTAFWDDFWASVRIPELVDTAKPFDRCFLPVLERHLRRQPPPSVVEIGCAPGRWLIHCAKAFGCQVAGYEFAASALAKTRENLAASGVEAELIQADFTTAALPEARYDAVLSLGFIEHFDDPRPVLDRHLRLLKPGGLLILDVPNFHGLNKLFLDWTGSELLAAHNLRLMKPGALRSLAKDAGLEILESGYLGGFEPSFFDANKAPLLKRLPISVLCRLRKTFRWMDHLNASWLSACIYGVFRKPGGGS